MWATRDEAPQPSDREGPSRSRQCGLNLGDYSIPDAPRNRAVLRHVSSVGSLVESQVVSIRPIWQSSPDDTRGRIRKRAFAAHEQIYEPGLGTFVQASPFDLTKFLCLLLKSNQTDQSTIFFFFFIGVKFSGAITVHIWRAKFRLNWLRGFSYFFVLLWRSKKEVMYSLDEIFLVFNYRKSVDPMKLHNLRVSDHIPIRTTGRVFIRSYFAPTKVRHPPLKPSHIDQCTDRFFAYIWNSLEFTNITILWKLWNFEILQLFW